MMNIFLADLVVNFPVYLYIRSNAAIAETVIAFKKNLIAQTMGCDVTLNNFQQVFIPSRKTGTSETDNDFTAMIHRSY
jgi:hypothetical protein